jgi:hypothetical protein
VRIVELSPQWESRWDDYVAAHPAGLLYHSLRFRDFLTALLGCEARYALACEGDGVEGVFPLVAREGSYGSVLNSLAYFGSPGGPLASSAAARGALVGWYEAQLADPRVAAATVIANPFESDGTPVPHDMTDVRVNHATELSAGDPGEAVRSVVHSSARRNVAKALRAGIRVEVENDSLGELARLHRLAMEAVGGSVKSDDFFAAVPAHFRPATDYELYVARLDGVAVAALLIFHFRDTVEYYVPAGDLEHRSLQPLAAILARAMADAAQRGARLWNWGGSWPSHESLMRFKAKWGGRPRSYSYWVKVNSPDVLEAKPQALLDAYPGFYVRPFAPVAVAAETVA